MIPNVSREKLLEAMQEFDEELRGTEEWSDWKQKGTYKYAIVHGGHRYPVKQIISMATGEPKTSFSGGSEANNYVNERGLSTILLEDDNTTELTVRDGLEEILADYAAARASEPFAEHDLGHTFKGVSHTIDATNTVSGRPTLTTKASRGQGNWATIPWVAILDSRETNSIQRGVYCVYLFREDMSGVYLALAQGVTEPKAKFGGDAGARRHLRARAKDLRPRFEQLGQYGFLLDDGIDLRTQANLGKNYEASTILYKFYETGSIPDDSVLINDLEKLVSAFEGFLQTQSDTKVAPSIGQLSAMTNFSPSQLKEIESLCSTKKQVIFEGPPGVGKTYVAELFARYFTGNQLEGAHDERIVVVQFHQSYGYEDFVQGIRPDTNARGQLEYHVRDGIFKRLCEVAEHNSDKNFVIVIDEINRGNISRIFGELLFLLEYRHQEVSLPYSRPYDPKFSIPKNVYLLGTMNTTDRSLAQIDYALRRRFYFYRMLPVVDGSAPVLERWLEKRDFDQETRERVLQLFVALNKRVQVHLGEHYQVGHSYFMTPEIVNEAGQKRVWDYEVMPLLEEYFYNWREKEKVISEFQIESLLSDKT